ncbi:MAG TPA: aminotransferase class I/II-fold pyridoxal phosphate-dependent enzyme [Gemmatimonadaceae bacterium]|jgi:aspartate/methionine/tyrosine aminotransferase
MHIADFALERYFAKWEFAVRHVLCASDIEPVGLSELLSLADDDSRSRWDALRLGYTESLGLPALREEIAELYPGLGADDVMTFAGAEEAIFLGMHAMLQAGDHAVVVWPAYQSLHEVARSIGAAITFVPLDPNGWTLDVNAVAAAMRPNTRVIVINFPHSPTGAQIDPEQFERLKTIAELHGVHLLSDEVYRLLEHGTAPLPTAAAASDRGVSVGVMSKAFGLAGLRIGWLATRNASLRARFAALKDYTTICNSAPSEILALTALRAKATLLQRARTIIADNLTVLDEFFRNHADRVTWTSPRAGSVCFPKLRNGSVDEFCAALVEREGVLLLPASQFGYPGNHFRLGYGRRDMVEGLSIVERFFREN